MRVVSVNVGLPREVEWQGTTVWTGIFKEPVASTVALRTLNLDGDAQADLTVHGGRDKAVYVYPAEHYADWEGRLGHQFPLAHLVRTSLRKGSLRRVFISATSSGLELPG